MRGVECDRVQFRGQFSEARRRASSGNARNKNT